MPLEAFEQRDKMRGQELGTRGKAGLKVTGKTADSVTGAGRQSVSAMGSNSIR